MATAKKEVKETKAKTAKAKTVKKAKVAKKVEEVKAEATEEVVETVEVSSEDAPKTEAGAKTAEKKAKVSKHKWYVLQARSNYEKRVQSHIREQVMMQGLENEVEEVLIPMEEVIEVKKGVKKRSEKKFFPGYVLVKAILTDKVWHLLKTTTHVISFVGSAGGHQKPLAISNKEAEHMLKQMESGVEKPRSLVTYEIGEDVRVVDGPFDSFNGIVEDVDEDKNRLKVSVSIFGRATPIDLDFAQVEKA